MQILLLGAATAFALLLGANPALASSYETVFATIIDPIQNTSGGPHPYAGPNLEPFAGLAGADLSFALLEDANLDVADLRFVNFDGAVLDGASLSFALLIDASMIGVRLVDAILSNANLFGADLTNGVVGRADLRQANLIGAIFTGATLQQSNLIDANLTDADLRGTSLLFATLEMATLDGALYDENTTFPSGGAYDSPPWDLDFVGTTPWDRGMIPAPEPSIGWMLVCGASGLIGLMRARDAAAS